VTLPGGNGFGVLVVTSEDTNSIGFVGGVGAEVLLSPSLGVGAEGLYHSFDFGHGDFALSNDFLTVSGRLTVHLNPSANASLSDPARVSASTAWTGFYAGGHFGTLHNLANEVIDSVALSNGQDGGAGIRGNDGGGGGGGALAFASLQGDAGLTGGGHIGYNWQINSLVFGAEADVDASSEDSNQIFGSARGRFGWTNQEYLFYGTAGIAVVSDSSVREVFAGSGGPGDNGGPVGAGPGGAGGVGGRALARGADETEVGLVMGVGLEAPLSSRTTAGVEGLYYDFEETSDPPSAPALGRTFVAGDDTSDALVVRTRFSFVLHP